MNCEKTGNLICTLRKEKNLTQQQLADKIGVSDKAVSKWERGLGCPDISLISVIAEIFGVSTEIILSGELNANDKIGGNMKNLKFYVCPDCGNILTSASEAEICCCGKKLKPLEAKKADECEKLNVEVIENDYFISSDHEMTKEHYIMFTAFLTGDGIIMKRQYPEWNYELRIPRTGHGILVWYCSKDGLFKQII